MVFRWQIHSRRPKASVKLATHAKQVSYMNIYVSTIPKQSSNSSYILANFFHNKEMA